ncbi:MAG: RtcB family protein [Nitrospirae bacterium]|nr:MAG: RtcB family protein [Nitrospirota bacterium]
MPIGGVISKARVPVKVWSDLNLIESQAIDQLVNTANLPCVYKHIAVMPDVHVGIGATVGSVIPTKDAIIPAAVGVDIGCGMLALKTQYTSEVLEGRLKKIRDKIEAYVPVGPTAHRSPLKGGEGGSLGGLERGCPVRSRCPGPYEQGARPAWDVRRGQSFH